MKRGQVKENEAPIDAECASRLKKTSSVDHVVHLVRIGWAIQSTPVMNLIKEHRISKSELLNALKENGLIK